VADRRYSRLGVFEYARLRPHTPARATRTITTRHQSFPIAVFRSAISSTNIPPRSPRRPVRTDFSVNTRDSFIAGVDRLRVRATRATAFVYSNRSILKRPGRIVFRYRMVTHTRTVRYKCSVQISFRTPPA